MNFVEILADLRSMLEDYPDNGMDWSDTVEDAMNTTWDRLIDR